MLIDYLGIIAWMEYIKPITKHLKELLPLSAPLLVAKLGVPVRGLAITWIFIKLSPQALAAGALAYSLLIAMLTFFLGVLMSSVGVSVAYATGANDTVAVTKILYHGFWLGMLLAIPGMILLYNVSPILLFLGQDKTIVALAAQFSQGLAWIFIPYTVLVNAYKLFTNLKKTHIPMFYSFGGLFVTVLFSYALALGKWGLPAMGIAGVGWGMAIAYWFQAIFILVHLYFGRFTKTYALFSRLTWPKKESLYSLWKIGWPVGLKYNIEFSLFFVMAVLIGAKSHQALAVYQVILQFFMLSSCLSSGIGLGTETILGQAIGGERYTEIKPACYAGLLLTTLYIAIVAVVILMFPQWIAHFFFVTGSVTFVLFIQSIVWVVLFQFLDSFRKVMTAILVTFKDSRFPLMSELIGLWVIGLPTAYLLGVTYSAILTGVLTGLIIGVFVSVVAMGFRMQYQINGFVKTAYEERLHV